MSQHPASFKPYLNDTIARIAPIIAGVPHHAAYVELVLRQPKGTTVSLLSITDTGGMRIAELDPINMSGHSVLTMSHWQRSFDAFTNLPVIMAVKYPAQLNFIAVLDPSDPLFMGQPVLGVNVSYQLDEGLPEYKTHLILMGFEDLKSATHYTLLAERPLVTGYDLPLLSNKFMCEWHEVE